MQDMKKRLKVVHLWIVHIFMSRFKAYVKAPPSRLTPPLIIGAFIFVVMKTFKPPYLSNEKPGTRIVFCIW